MDLASIIKEKKIKKDASHHSSAHPCKSHGSILSINALTDMSCSNNDRFYT